jgi:putative transposase
VGSVDIRPAWPHQVIPASAQQRDNAPEQAQRFLSAHAMIYGHFRQHRHLMTTDQYRRSRNKALRIWRQETCAQMAT